MKVTIDSLDIEVTYKLIPLSWEGYGRGKPKEMRFVSYSEEGYQITKSGSKEYRLRGVFECEDYEELSEMSADLIEALSAPGTRTVWLNENEMFSLVALKGFQLSQIWVEDTRVTAVLEVDLLEASETVPDPDFAAIVDEDDEPIIDEDDNILTY